MKLEAMGIDSASGIHDRKLTHAETVFVEILWRNYEGKDNRASADALAVQWGSGIEGFSIALSDLPGTVRRARGADPKALLLAKREVRTLQNHLLFDHDDIPVMSKAGPGGGYWMAGSVDEMEEFFNTFRMRGITGIKKAARGRKAGVIDAFKQLTFEFEEEDSRVSYAGKIKRRVELPGALDVVDAYLERMMADPEQFADGLRKIGRKYGSVLLPKEVLAEIVATSARFQELVKSISP